MVQRRQDLYHIRQGNAAGTWYGLSGLSRAAMPFVLVPVLKRWGAGPMFVVVATALWTVVRRRHPPSSRTVLGHARYRDSPVR
jgi:hypothetical protein